jgi:hypothetical protein
LRNFYLSKWQNIHVRKYSRSLLANLQARFVFFFPLFHGENFLPEVSELGEFLPDRFQPFVSAPMIYLRLGVRVRLAPILGI